MMVLRNYKKTLKEADQRLLLRNSLNKNWLVRRLILLPFYEDVVQAFVLFCTLTIRVRTSACLLRWTSSTLPSGQFLRVTLFSGYDIAYLNGRCFLPTFASHRKLKKVLLLPPPPVVVEQPLEIKISFHNSLTGLFQLNIFSVR